MSTDKNGRKSPFKVVLIIIALIIASYFGIDYMDIIPNQANQPNADQSTIQTPPNEPNNSQSQVPSEVPTGILYFTMINVGQADCFLLEQDGQVALVDCGTRFDGDEVVEYLQSKEITKIDYIIGTHPHDDHMGGMYDVITNFEIGKVIIPDVAPQYATTKWYIKLMNEITSEVVVNEKSTPKYQYEYPEIGTIYQLGDATMKVIGPISKEPKDANNYSIVLKVSFGEMDIIMTGDAEKEVEREILESGENIDAEILKVGHHGSDTSSSVEFLDAIDPDYAFISTKVGNKYEHPIKVTMDNLKERNIIVYRSDENGTVVAEITATGATFSCEPGDYLSGVELEERVGK